MTTSANAVKKEQTTQSFDLAKGLIQEFNRFSRFSYVREASFFDILYNKIHDHSLPMRAQVAYLLYNYIKSQCHLGSAYYDKFFLQKFPFILEVIISIQYYHNQILDGKGGVTSAEAININLIKANLLKEQLYRYIEDTSELPEFDIQRLINTVRAIFEWVDIGQYLEEHTNTYKSINQLNIERPFQNTIYKLVDVEQIEMLVNLTISIVPNMDFRHETYLRRYYERIYLTNAALYKLSTGLMLSFTKIKASDKKRIIDFVTYFALASQIVNDNADMIPSYYGEKTIQKKAEDAMSDLKNRNITLPLYIHIDRFPEGKMVEFLKSDNKKIEKKEEKELFHEFVTGISVFYSMAIAKNIGKKAAHILDKENLYYKQLVSKLDHIGNNRYYWYYYDYNGGSAYKCYRRQKQHN